MSYVAQHHLMPLEEFRLQYFNRTISRVHAVHLIQSGALPGLKLGSRWYVDIARFDAQLDQTSPAPSDPRALELALRLCRR